MASTSTLSIRVTANIKEKLENLSEATGRSKSFLAAEAIENYLENQAWQVAAIKKAVDKADSKTAKFADHEQVTAWLDTWGAKKKTRPPKCK